MKQKISQFIENSIRLPAGLRFNRNGDNTVIHQDDVDDDTMFYVYIESETDTTLYDGLMFSKFQSVSEVIEKIRIIAEELKERI